MVMESPMTWDPEQHLSFIEKLGIEKSIVSITSSGTHLVPGDRELAVKVTRESKDYAADLKRRLPEKFGFWASLPLPFVDESIQEIQHSFDALGADGIGLVSNYHGRYLGDPDFDLVFAELNRRASRAFIHPTGPCVAGSNETLARRASPLTQYPDPMFEYLFATARCVINLFLSGTITRYPNITYVLSHAGGALPPLVQRFTTFSEAILKLDNGVNAASVKTIFQDRFFFDLAGFAFPDQIHGILRYVDSSRILYGSDYPYTPASGVEMLAKLMEKDGPTVFTKEGEWDAVENGNARRLLQK